MNIQEFEDRLTKINAGYAETLVKVATDYGTAVGTLLKEGMEFDDQLPHHLLEAVVHHCGKKLQADTENIDQVINNAIDALLKGEAL